MKNVRIVFSKTGRARYMSHLDLVRTMTRAVRRADIPLWYTEGFNRHPYITFAAPLSLGFESQYETMDLRLEEDIPFDVLVQRMNDAFPEGLRALSADEVKMKAGALFSAKYRLSLSATVTEVEAFLKQLSIIMQKRTKKGGLKDVDIRPCLQDVSCESTDSGCDVTVTLPCNSTDTINPQMIHQALSAFLARELPPMRVLRLALYGENGQLFV